MGKNFLLKLCYQGAPIYWCPGSNILEPLLVKNMCFVLFSNMNHGELKVPSPFVRPSSDTQNLVLSELSLFIPPQNIENKILGLQYIGAWLQYIGAPKCYWLFVVCTLQSWSLLASMFIVEMKKSLIVILLEHISNIKWQRILWICYQIYFRYILFCWWMFWSQSCVKLCCCLLRIQLKLNTALLFTVRSSVRPFVCVSQAWHLTYLTYIKA